MTTIATSLERCTLITLHERAPHTVPQDRQLGRWRPGRSRGLSAGKSTWGELRPIQQFARKARHGQPSYRFATSR